MTALFCLKSSTVSKMKRRVEVQRDGEVNSEN